MDQNDGDMEVDQCLLKFSSMGTTDKDVLVSQFCTLVGSQVEPKACEFFLEMNNWNLQAAIGSYYDYKTPAVKMPMMAFVRDVTIGEGESVPPDTKFLKTWLIQNTGEESWPANCTLRFVNGDKMDSPDWVAVRSLGARDTLNISVRMKSPERPGIYQGQWRMFNQSMVPFGDVIWVIITVDHGGLLGVTQQMSQFASTLGSNGGEMAFTESHKNSNNPFSFNSLGGDTDMEMGSSGVNEHMMTQDNSVSMKCSTSTSDYQSRVAPSPSCWSERSPTSSGPVDELLVSRAHSLTVINEEASSLPSISGDKSNKNWQYNASRSSYDLNATPRQVSPSGSPSRILEIEKTLASPDAPSPIRPTAECLFSKVDKPIRSSQRLDFSSDS